MTAGTMGYDRNLQMYVEAPHDPEPRHLAFQRWLVEHGRCEHEAAGPSCGALVIPESTQPEDGAP